MRSCWITAEGSECKKSLATWLGLSIAGATLAVAINLTGLSRVVQMYAPKVCHPQRNGMESRGLRIIEAHQRKSVQGVAAVQPAAISGPPDR